jgi:hypothetical protein
LRPTTAVDDEEDLCSSLATAFLNLLFSVRVNVEERKRYAVLYIWELSTCSIFVKKNVCVPFYVLGSDSIYQPKHTDLERLVILSIPIAPTLSVGHP